MVLAAILLFCLAVSLGLYLVMLGVRHRRGSKKLAALHASVALLGLITLSMQVFNGPVNFLYNSAALLFVLALLGGLMMLAVRMGDQDKHAPPSMLGVSMHASMGLIALVLLALGYVRA